MYNMTQFAMTLNEKEVKGYDLPPTDSRLRPDIRALENGEIGEWGSVGLLGDIFTY